MVDIGNYAGREQAFIKHFFFKNYVETLFFRLANKFNHIVYIDGFSGPWQSNDEEFKDTSFGIALDAMKMVKSHYKEKGSTVNFTAHLVEQNTNAYRDLAKIPAKYPDLTIKTYNADFLDVVEEISNSVSKNSFCFIFIDPKGWKIDLMKLKPLMSLKNSEVIFNFMFDFINRFVTHPSPAVAEGLNMLFPYSEDWRDKIFKTNSSLERKEAFFEIFALNLRRLGSFEFSKEIDILKPTKDRTLYGLFYATRNEIGIEVFRSVQVKALNKQIQIRGATKVKSLEDRTGQTELFANSSDIAPSLTGSILDKNKAEARAFILRTVPNKPESILYKNLRLEVVKRFIVTFSDINKICKALKDENLIEFPDWEKGKRVPKPNYRVQK